MAARAVAGDIWRLDADRRGSRRHSGYEVAWKVAGADVYTVWNTDSNGNYITNLLPEVVWKQPCVGGSGTELPPGLERRRRDRAPHHGDPVVRIDHPGQGGQQLFSRHRSGSGPELKYGRRACGAGHRQAGRRSERKRRTAVMRSPGSSSEPTRTTVWSTDSNGNYLSNPLPEVSGSSPALEALEPSFHQDLNGDGIIGPPTTVIELFGSISLVEAGSNYFLDVSAAGPAPS